MKQTPLHSARGFHRIGVRTNLVLLGLISFFLIASGYGIWALKTQGEQLDSLTETYYDRAMLAAELSRDAELIATQAMEKAVTQRLANIDANILQSDITRMFTVARDKLTAHGPNEAALLIEIDRLTQPYFTKLTEFYKNIENRQRLQQRMETMMLTIESNLKQPLMADSNDFSKSSHELSSATLLMLQANRPGLLARRQARVERLSADLNALTDLSVNEMNHRQLTNRFVEQSLQLKTRLDQANRITLASMRETRVYAQRLSSACYDLYLLVKQSATQAALQHTQNTQQVIWSMAAFCLIFICLIGLAYWLVQHFIIQRLNHLSSIMLRHTKNDPQPIPVSGKDEITVIGQAFQTFVDANNAAKHEANQAHKIVEQTNQKLIELNASLLQQSNTDELTQIANRRAFFTQLNTTWSHHSQHTSISILMIDIDWFKAYNDHYGHQAGDTCLKAVVQQLKTACEPYQAVLARYGGEEFIAAVLDLTEQQAHALGESMLSHVLEARLTHTHCPNGNITISVGSVTQAFDGSETSFERLISNADQALYQAKEAGRNQVVSKYLSTASESTL